MEKKKFAKIWEKAQKAAKSAWNEEENLYSSSRIYPPQTDFQEDYYESEFYEDNIYDEPEYMQPYHNTSSTIYNKQSQI